MVLAIRSLDGCQAIGAGVEPVQRGELRQLEEEAQAEREDGRARKALLEVVAQVHAERNGQKDVEQDLPEREAPEEAEDGRKPERLVLSIGGDVLEGDEAEMVLPAVADGGVTLGKRERHQEVDDEQVEDVDVILSGRTLSKSQWNTLCLPFSMDATQIAAGSLNGATIKELDAENSNLATNGTLTLTFSDVSSITAGKPYIVKWASGKNISDPVFYGVTINAMAPTAVTFTNNANVYGDCEFVGQYSPFSITDGNKNEIIMLGSSSRLGYSRNERTLKCFRAHFYVPANGGGTLARAFVMDFGDGETTEIIGATADQSSASATYTLDGRRINDLPTQKGMYIQNGRKVIIK